ncbi:MAG TPA: lysine--tRNA ligase [Candidatus Saccharimonadales bacterium]|nr:lysine--tRNA ligase [Candidatus Saccharimonadales bacterium]
MQWLNNAVDELLKRHPDGEIVVSSGVSPSGTYHLGTLREVATAEALARELRRRGRPARHLHIVDDLDSLRKVPVNIPEDFSRYLGKPLCDIPAPDGSDRSYADYFVGDLFVAADKMHMQLEVVRAHQKYRAGFFVPAIEKALAQLEAVKQILADISGHQVNDQWSPIQVVEGGYLKNRPFVSINTTEKSLVFQDKDGREQTIKYDDGQVKLNWRLDWPARWWLLGVQAEPFGRDHATKGGSYDTGAVLVKDIFGGRAPLPLPYNFINQTGETKKMSKSAGNVITAADLLAMLPPEVVWFFLLRYAPDKQLFFDEGPTLMRLVDEFGELLAKPEKTASDKQLIDLCLQGVAQPTVSRVPFSHLVASYQAALRDADHTLEIIRRTEHAQVVDEDAEIIRQELQFIDVWLDKRAPADVKFALREQVDAAEFSDAETTYLSQLADKIAAAPAAADGDWFHKAVYEFKDEAGLAPKELFSTLYRALIGQQSGPRAGWFLSILPRDWLIKRLKLEA